jgi:PAS domain S-box-containing protein
MDASTSTFIPDAPARVIVVDDDRDFAESVGEVLAAHGYDAQLATTWTEAQERLTGSGPVVALLDVVFGRQSGIELLQHLRSTQPSTVCVMMTAFASTDSAVRAVRLGAYDYLTKPLDPEQLVATIRRATERIQLEQGREQAERALRKSERQLAAILDLAADGVLSFGVDLTLRQFNQAAAALFGYGVTSALGRPASELIPAITELARPGSELRLRREVVGVRGDGSQFPAELAISRLEVDGLTLYSAIVRDLTAQQEAERTLLLQQEQLRHAQRMEAIGQLAGGIAHDFNNLLTVIQSAATSARAATEEPATREALDDVLSAAASSAGLARQLLAFARKQVLKPQPDDLNEVVASFTRMIRRVLGGSIEIVQQLCSEPLPLFADVRQLEQVLMNLAVNARDAMPQGGRLTIRTAQQSGDAVLEMEDTGMGMSDETRTRLFEPFFTTKGPSGGHGLGLATVYGIVVQCGGRIDVRSAPGEGTTFTVSLPLSSAPRAASPGPGASPRPSAAPFPAKAGVTVLVVDDQPELRRVARRILEKAGYRVLLAADGEEGLELFQQHASEVQVVVSDVRMPRRSGPSMVQALRALRPELPVIFTSGYAEHDVASSLTAATLDKPYTSDALLDHVARSLLEATSQDLS